jgi:DnaA family protein
MKLPATQIPLRLTPQELYHLNNFYFAQAELASAVESFCQQTEPSFLYLWGGKATGKTHLSLAIAEQAQKNSKTMLYFPLAELVETASPEVLEGVENLNLVCFDEFEAIAGLPQWEEALFHCFNRLQQSGCQLLIASRDNPAASTIQLADLRSRMATGLVYQLASLDDTAKQKVMMVQSQARGLDMTEDVAQYLLRHHSRDIVELMALLQKLDKASMAAQRRLTIPFVRQTLHSA